MTQNNGDGIYGAAEAPALADVDREDVEVVRLVRTARAEPTANNVAAARRAVDGLGQGLDSLEAAQPLPTEELNEVQRRGDRPWLIPGWLPSGRLAMLTGVGGVGKSFLALGMAAAAGLAATANRPGFHIMPQPPGVRAEPPVIGPGPVVYLSWEDEAEEAARRLQDVEKAHGLDPKTLGQGVHYLYAAALGPLWAPGLQSRWSISALAELTAAGRRVRALCEDKRARLLILDPVAAVFASDENNRGLVRAFCADWDAWALKNNCAVLLIAHPPKDGPNPYSGSSDWQAAVRALLTIELVDEDGRAPAFSKPKPHGPRLASKKSSYGPTPRPLWLQRHDTAHDYEYQESTGGAWFAADVLQEQGPGVDPSMEDDFDETR